MPVKDDAAKSESKVKPDGKGITVSANISKASIKSALAPPPAPAKLPPLPSPEVETYLMPDLRGRGVRAVMHACAQMHLNVRLLGSGIAVRQFPAAGSRVKAGDACKVEFE